MLFRKTHIRGSALRFNYVAYFLCALLCARITFPACGTLLSPAFGVLALVVFGSACWRASRAHVAVGECHDVVVPDACAFDASGGLLRRYVSFVALLIVLLLNGMFYAWLMLFGVHSSFIGSYGTLANYGGMLFVDALLVGLCSLIAHLVRTTNEATFDEKKGARTLLLLAWVLGCLSCYLCLAFYKIVSVPNSSTIAAFAGLLVSLVVCSIAFLIYGSTAHLAKSRGCAVIVEPQQEDAEERLQNRLSDFPQLTDREKQVLLLLLEGRNSAQSAEALDLKPSTVRAYLQRSYKKLNVSGGDEAISLLRGEEAEDPTPSDIPIAPEEQRATTESPRRAVCLALAILAGLVTSLGCAMVPLTASGRASWSLLQPDAAFYVGLIPFGMLTLLGRLNARSLLIRALGMCLLVASLIAIIPLTATEPLASCLAFSVRLAWVVLALALVALFLPAAKACSVKEGSCAFGGAVVVAVVLMAVAAKTDIPLSTLAIACCVSCAAAAVLRSSALDVGNQGTESNDDTAESIAGAPIVACYFFVCGCVAGSMFDSFKGLAYQAIPIAFCVATIIVGVVSLTRLAALRSSKHSAMVLVFFCIAAALCCIAVGRSEAIWITFALALSAVGVSAWRNGALCAKDAGVAAVSLGIGFTACSLMHRLVLPHDAARLMVSVSNALAVPLVAPGLAAAGMCLAIVALVVMCARFHDTFLLSKMEREYSSQDRNELAHEYLAGCGLVGLQLEVALLTIEGQSVSAIAEKLFYSQAAVSGARTAVYRIMQVHSASQLALKVAKFIEHTNVSPDESRSH